MPKKAQKTGEADFKAGFFQEYFGTKRFTYRQEIDRNGIFKPCISTLLMVYWIIFTQGEAWIP
jgi:hypothetical protein